MTLELNPPLLNSSNPWATTIADLRALYHCPHTGAVTTRTCTISGFAHDSSIHQFCFFDAHTNLPGCIQTSGFCEKSSTSLNTLGYSPYPLSQTLENVATVVKEADGKIGAKGFIVSVTGTTEELKKCYDMIARLQSGIPATPLYMEVNLSCPNIVGKPPPSYDFDALREYLWALKEARLHCSERGVVPIGIKTPPYSNPENFDIVKRALLDATSKGDVGAPIAFITATNTLGCSLVLSSPSEPALGSADGLGIGGMAGASLHPLALGNVKLLRRMLDSEEELRGIKLIGIGGVSDAAGFARMKSVGAEVVGVGTALGRKGVAVFEEIMAGLQ